MQDLTQLEPGSGRFGSDLVAIRHTMAETGLFTDTALASLIDNYPRDYFLFDSMSVNGSRQVWRHGDPAGLSGAEILEAIKTGQYWMNLRRFDLIAPEYDSLVTKAFGELEAVTPGLKTSRRSSSLLISSPGARVVYHADIPMICLWHLRGKKRVWLYDADNENHLPDTAREAVILRETEEAIPYDPAWDTQAITRDLEPGQAISWPLNAPHRVDNLEGLNVSITTEFFTPEALRSYGVHFANGYLRRRFGVEPVSKKLYGATAVAKIGLAMAVKGLRLHKKSERTVLCDFTLDKNRPGHRIDLPQNQRWPIPQA